MRHFFLYCVVIVFMPGIAHDVKAIGIKAIKDSEHLYQECLKRNPNWVPCFNKYWKYKSGRFSAIGKFDGIEKSSLSNLFAFFSFGEYSVSCRVSQKRADALEKIKGDPQLRVRGRIESFQIVFHSINDWWPQPWRHLRLARSCSAKEVP
jgi:hypothetical protein